MLDSKREGSSNSASMHLGWKLWSQKSQHKSFPPKIRRQSNNCGRQKISKNKIGKKELAYLAGKRNKYRHCRVYQHLRQLLPSLTSPHHLQLLLIGPARKWDTSKYRKSEFHPDPEAKQPPNKIPNMKISIFSYQTLQMSTTSAAIAHE